MCSVLSSKNSDDKSRELIDPFIYALCEGMVFEESKNLDESTKKMEIIKISDFFQNQIQNLPIPPRILFTVGMILFKGYVMARYFRGFNNLPPEKRNRIIANWAWGRSALLRQLFRVVRSTVFLAFYEIPEVRMSLESNPILEESSTKGGK